MAESFSLFFIVIIIQWFSAQGSPVSGPADDHWLVLTVLRGAGLGAHALPAGHHHGGFHGDGGLFGHRGPEVPRVPDAVIVAVVGVGPGGAVGEGGRLHGRGQLVQALGLEAVLALTRLPDVLSEGVASRHFPRSFTLAAPLSVHGKVFIR